MAPRKRSEILACEICPTGQVRLGTLMSETRQGNNLVKAASAISSRRVKAARFSMMPLSRRSTAVDSPFTNLFDRSAMASNIGLTFEGELAIAFNISAVAACCSRASLRSSLGPEAGRRLTGAAAGAMWRLGLAVLRPFDGFPLRLSPRSSCRPFLMAAPFPPPGSRRASYRAKPSFRKGRLGWGRRLPAKQSDVR